MTKASIRKQFINAIAAFTLVALIGILISIKDDTKNRVIFGTFKDLLPLFLVGCGAWLAYCIQRRSAYQQQLRVMWSKLAEAIRAAVQYTHLTAPDENQYRATLLKLSIAIEESRGVFKNLAECETDKGYYPFEPLKDIYGCVGKLGFGTEFTAKKAEQCEQQIEKLWKDVRKEILREFDRESPAFPRSHWTDSAKPDASRRNKLPKP